MYIKEAIKKLIQLFLYKIPQPIVKRKTNPFVNQISKRKLFKIAKFGDLNPDKIFYIIKRDPGAGIFSNFVYIMNHLRIAYVHEFIPYIDMEKWPSWYSEDEPINNTMNSWEYYFHQVCEYSSEEIYQSKNIIITRNDFYNDFSKTLIDDPIFKILFKKYIKIQDHINKEAQDFIDKNFKDKKVMGVYLRGGECKRTPNHTMPPTKKQVECYINETLKKNDFDLIFLSTKEIHYEKIFQNSYKNQLKVYDSFKDEKDCFQIYPRKNHRYLLGKEIIVEMLILSKLENLSYNLSNVSLMSLFFNLNSKQSRYLLDNGTNCNNKFLAQIYWYIKYLLPEFLGGFKKNILKKIST